MTHVGNRNLSDVDLLELLLQLTVRGFFILYLKVKVFNPFPEHYLQIFNLSTCTVTSRLFDACCAIYTQCTMFQKFNSQFYTLSVNIPFLRFKLQMFLFFLYPMGFFKHIKPGVQFLKTFSSIFVIIIVVINAMQ